MMRRNNTSVAYDYSRIENLELKKPKLTEEKNEEHIKKVRHADSRARLFKYICLGAIVGSICCLIIHNDMKMTELSDIGASLKSQLSKQQSEQSRLSAVQESLYNSSAVEQYVQNNLNMIKLEKANVEYVKLPIQDKFLRAEAPRQSTPSYFMRGITNCFGRIVEYLS